jgi:hypothetical protein
MRWASILVMIVALHAPISLGQAQKQHVRWFKLVGKVLDKNGRPIQWGQVCLKETHAHFLRIKPIDRDGRFALMWLDSRLDYELYADQGDTFSTKVFVSDPQEASEIVVNLKLSGNQNEK